MPIPADTIVSLIKAALPDADVIIRDLAGDNDHFQVTITSAAFVGKTPIQQHRLVYQALDGRVGQDLHALSIQTKIPKPHEEKKQ